MTYVAVVALFAAVDLDRVLSARASGDEDRSLDGT